MLVSVFFVALIGLGVKLLCHIPAIEVIFFNALGSLIAGYATLRHRGIAVSGNNQPLLLARGLLGTLGVTLYFFTLQHIPFPSAITLHYTAPIFAALIGSFMVKKPLRLRQLLFIGISFSGVALINGFKLTDTSWYIVSGLAGAFFRGLSNSIVAKIKDSEHPLVITFYSYAATVPLAGAYLLYDFVMPGLLDAAVLCGITVLGYAAHYYSVKAYQVGPLAVVAGTAYVAVIYALLFSYLLLGESMPPEKLIGVGLVLAGVLLNVFWRRKKPA